MFTRRNSGSVADSFGKNSSFFFLFIRVVIHVVV